jgi:hypothetical protein
VIVEDVCERARDPLSSQIDLAARIGQIGTIIIKSIERSDRDVAAEGAWAIKVLLDHYDKFKARMPKEWFVVDRADFVGFSDDALEMLTEARTWYEMKAMQQLEVAFQRGLQSSADHTVSTFSDALRVIATRAHERHDDQSLRLGIRFFNNYLREAIRSGNVRAVYDVFHQYRRLGRDLVDRPELLRELGKHFVYYAGMSRTFGMKFAPQLTLFDLGYVARRAYERASPAAGDLLKDMLGLPHRTGDDVHSMAVKAKLMIGGFFVGHKLDAEAELVRANLRDVGRSEIERTESELLAATRAFFEVTDRQLNVEYVPPDRREPLRAFCASLQPAA